MKNEESFGKRTVKHIAAIILGAAFFILHSSLIPPPSSLSIIFTGDVLLDRGVRQRINHVGADALFSRSIDSLFREADVVVGNLECPATAIKQPCFKKFVFRGEPEWLNTLRKHGFTHLNLANNHSIDQGRAGLLDTRQNILAAGMVPFGADSTMQAAAEPVLLAATPRPVYVVPSLRLALENYSYLPEKASPSQEPFDSLCLRISRLRHEQPQAYIIVSLHWGGEHTLRPVPQQREEAHHLIDSGADILICHHPHTLQTIENYRGHLIYYSIGNFIFDQQRPLNTRACMVRLKVSADTACVETIPIEIRHCVPYVVK